MNFLEQLAAEWYEYSGYFVRTNVRARKRAKGGWDMELDVLAYQPTDNSLLHVEASGDSESWSERKSRFLGKKFILTKSEYEEILESPVDHVHRLALVGWSRMPKADLDWGKNIEVITVPMFLDQISERLGNQNFMSDSVPESYPILRTIQMVLNYKT